MVNFIIKHFFRKECSQSLLLTAKFQECLSLKLL